MENHGRVIMYQIMYEATENRSIRIYIFMSFTHIAIELNFSRSPLQDSLMEISKKCPSIICKYFVTKPENENCTTGTGSIQTICRFNSGITLLSIYNVSH